MKKVVISLHDASPVFQKEVEAVLRHIDQKKSFLITPYWHSKGKLDKDFADMMKGEDNLLHGFTHRSSYFDPYSILYMNKKLSREFLYLDYKATRDKIISGMQLFGDTLEVEPTGFIPPMWYHNQYTIGVLKELNFLYTETWTSFFDLQKDVKQCSIPLSLDYGNNIFLSKLYYKGWKVYHHLSSPSLVRIAIHPSDIRNGLLIKIKKLVNKLEDADYTFLTYKELITQEQSS